MAWSVNDIFLFLQKLTRKNQSASITATDFFYNWNGEQYMYHADLLGSWQAKNVSKEGNNIGMIQDETVIVALTPFIMPPTTITISSGNAPKPTDFAYTLDLRRNSQAFLFITADQRSSVENSVIDPPSDTAPYQYYTTEYSNFYYLLPHNMTGDVELDYIKSPTNVEWGYTFDGDGRQVYDGGTSVQPQWLQNDIVEITKRSLTNFGVDFKDADFVNYGRTAQQTGN